MQHMTLLRKTAGTLCPLRQQSPGLLVSRRISPQWPASWFSNEMILISTEMVKVGPQLSSVCRSWFCFILIASGSLAKKLSNHKILLEFKYKKIQKNTRSDIKILKYLSDQVFEYSSKYSSKYLIIQVFKYSNIQIFQYILHLLNDLMK